VSKAPLRLNPLALRPSSGDAVVEGQWAQDVHGMTRWAGKQVWRAVCHNISTGKVSAGGPWYGPFDKHRAQLDADMANKARRQEK